MGYLTFELTGPERRGSLARLAKMYRVPPTGPSWPAAEGPVERGVRPHANTAESWTTVPHTRSADSRKATARAAMALKCS